MSGSPVSANRLMVERKVGKRKAEVDKIAACYILQGFWIQAYIRNNHTDSSLWHKTLDRVNG